MKYLTPFPLRFLFLFYCTQNNLQPRTNDLKKQSLINDSGIPSKNIKKEKGQVKQISDIGHTLAASISKHCHIFGTLHKRLEIVMKPVDTTF